MKKTEKVELWTVRSWVRIPPHTNLFWIRFDVRKDRKLEKKIPGMTHLEKEYSSRQRRLYEGTACNNILS